MGGKCPPSELCSLMASCWQSEIHARYASNFRNIQCLTLTLTLKRTNETLVLAAWPEALDNRIYPAITRSNSFITSWRNQTDRRNQNRIGNQPYQRYQDRTRDEKGQNV